MTEIGVSRSFPRRDFLAAGLAGLLAAPLVGCSRGASPARRPNIVVVMADDIGPGDIGFYHAARTGSPPVIPTPHLDAMIRDGMRFDQAYSPSALCAPTRFSMLTGNYSYRQGTGRPYGVWAPWQDPGIDPTNTTSARLARQAGYATAFFGKWGCGGQMFDRRGEAITTNDVDDADFSTIGMAANHHGFDYAFELPRGIQIGPFAFYENEHWKPLGNDSELVRLDPAQHRVEQALLRRHEIGDSNWDPAAAGPILVERATNYISTHLEERPDQPLFLYFCSQGVHIPHVPPEELNGTPISGTTPSARGDMVVEVDTQVGELIDALRAGGGYDDTLFIFTSDNGGLPAVDDALVERGHDSANGLRASKGSIHEGGCRVPFIATWPGVIEPGTHSAEPIVGHDVVATIAAIGETGPTPQVKDSLDLVPLLSGHADATGHEIVMQQSSPKRGGFAIRRGDWKLVLEGDDLEPTGLFDLASNPFEVEEQNLLSSPDRADLVDELRALYVELRETGRPTVALS